MHFYWHTLYYPCAFENISYLNLSRIVPVEVFISGIKDWYKWLVSSLVHWLSNDPFKHTGLMTCTLCVTNCKEYVTPSVYNLQHKIRTPRPLLHIVNPFLQILLNGSLKDIILKVRNKSYVSILQMRIHSDCRLTRHMRVLFTNL